MDVADIGLLKTFGTLAVVLAALAGGAAVVLGSRLSAGRGAFLVRGEAFAAGIFLGAGLIHMLGDAAGEFATGGVDYPAAEVIAGATILALLWAEHLGGRTQNPPVQGAAGLALLATATLSVHALLAGAAFGTAGDLGNAVIVLIAILAHKSAAAFALASKLGESRLTKRTRLLCFLVFLAVFPFGVALGAQIAAADNASPLFAASILSLAAGTFLYLGTLHGLTGSTMVARCCNVAEFALVVAGFTLMAIVAVWT